MFITNFQCMFHVPKTCMVWHLKHVLVTFTTNSTIFQPSSHFTLPSQVGFETFYVFIMPTTNFNELFPTISPLLLKPCSQLKIGYQRISIAQYLLLVQYSLGVWLHNWWMGKVCVKVCIFFSDWATDDLSFLPWFWL